MITLFALTVLAIMPIVLLKIAGRTSLLSMFIQNNNIVLLIVAALLVLLCDRIQFNNTIINWLCSSVLAIYLLTDNDFRNVLDPWLLKHIIGNPIAGYGITALICVSCLFVDKVRVFLLTPITSKLLDRVRKIDVFV